MTVDMRFVDAAKQAFSFMQDAGFRLTQDSPARLQYETALVVVAIEWDARSGELDVLIGLQPKKGERRDAFSLTDLLAMENVPERRMPFQVADESKLAPFLERLATDTRANAQSALAGDRMYFWRLNTFRSAQAIEFERDMKLRCVRSEAEIAWQKRDLERLIASCSSTEEDLTSAEQAKLAYAKKHRKL
jgi:hypothetical protein